MGWLTPLLVLLILFAPVAQALEADQYQIWKFEKLKDSTEAVNRHLNRLLQEVLDRRINRRFRIPATPDGSREQFPVSKSVAHRKTFIADKAPYTCEVVAKKYMAYIRPHFFLNKFKRRIKKDDGIYFHPAQKHLLKDYRDSIYRGFMWPFWMPVSQTIRINNVHLGADKLDHFFSSGRRYLKAYYRRRASGMNHGEAMASVIRFGVTMMEERGVLGLWTSGAFSYADLEANFQGMMLGLNFCGSARPHVKRESDGRWVIAHPIDMGRYVNPLWDEAFNNSYYVAFRQNGISRVLKQEYCELGRSPKAKRLWGGYRKQLGPAPFQVRVLQDLMRAGKIPNPSPQSLNAVCEYPDGFMEGVPYW